MSKNVEQPPIDSDTKETPENKVTTGEIQEQTNSQIKIEEPLVQNNTLKNPETQISNKSKLKDEIQRIKAENQMLKNEYETYIQDSKINESA